MAEYRVVWEIDIVADNPIQAALKAREVQLNSESWANVFEVGERGNSDTYEIDLDDVDAYCTCGAWVGDDADGCEFCGRGEH